MSRGIVLCAGFTALVLLCFLSVQIQAPAIEIDLLQRSTTVLAANRIPAGGLAFHGRDAVLRGPKDSLGVSDRAVRIVAGVPGVRTVELKTTAETSTPAAVEPALPSRSREVQARLDATLAGRIVEFNPVNSESTELTANGKSALNEVALVLAESPDAAVEIQGHTDSRVDAGQSVILTKRKAEAVKAYLIGRSIPPERLSTVGYGGSKPIADNATWPGRRQNRRIEFEVKREGKP